MGQLEGVFWRDVVRPNVTGLWKRIETGTMSSFPDCVVLIEGVTALVELKSKHAFEPGLGTTALQRNFLHTWARNGGNAFLLAQAGTEVFFLRGQDVEKDLSPDEWRRRSLLNSDRKVFDWQGMCKLIAQGGCR